jgi:phenylpropionate dioxygenase-like ring-hydroxylating dioxygenase large terminal subunit
VTPLPRLLDTLRCHAALPFERAESLPPELYHRADVYELEQERIFRREWMAVARAADLAQPGDWQAFDLAGEPVLLVCGADGRLRVLSRVCRHRGLDLGHGQPAQRGNARSFQCPYHLWTYRLDGTLLGAPEMERSRAFSRERCALPEFALEVWQGFVFVSLDREAAPLAPRLREVEPALGGIDLSGWASGGVLGWGRADVNWKVAMENACECYHHLGTHGTTLQPLWPAQEVVLDASPDDWVASRLRVSAEAATGVDAGHRVHPTFFPAAPGLTPQQRSETLILGVFPMFFVVIAPDHAFWFRWLPTGPESHELDIHLLVPAATREEPGFAERAAALLELARGVQAEDCATNVAVQRCLHARAAAPGPLSHHERPLWQLQRWLAERLAPVGA